MPQHLVSSGTLAKLSEGAHKLYQFLLFSAQERSRAVLEISNLEIRQLAKLSPTTIRRARTELWELRLIDLRRSPGGPFQYMILNPSTGVPLPGSSFDSKRGHISIPSPNATPAWNEIGA